MLSWKLPCNKQFYTNRLSNRPDSFFRFSFHFVTLLIALVDRYNEREATFVLYIALQARVNSLIKSTQVVTTEWVVVAFFHFRFVISVRVSCCTAWRTVNRFTAICIMSWVASTNNFCGALTSLAHLTFLLQLIYHLSLLFHRSLATSLINPFFLAACETIAHNASILLLT